MKLHFPILFAIPAFFGLLIWQTAQDQHQVGLPVATIVEAAVSVCIFALEFWLLVYAIRNR